MPERIVTVNIPQGARYDITVAPGLLHRAGELLRNLSKSNKAAIVTDTHLAVAHLTALKNSLESAGQMKMFA